MKFAQVTSRISRALISDIRTIVDVWFNFIAFSFVFCVCHFSCYDIVISLKFSTSVKSAQRCAWCISDASFVIKFSSVFFEGGSNLGPNHGLGFPVHFWQLLDGVTSERRVNITIMMYTYQLIVLISVLLWMVSNQCFHRLFASSSSTLFLQSGICLFTRQSQSISKISLASFRFPFLLMVNAFFKKHCEAIATWSFWDRVSSRSSFMTFCQALLCLRWYASRVRLNFKGVSCSNVLVNCLSSMSLFLHLVGLIHLVAFCSDSRRLFHVAPWSAPEIANIHGTCPRFINKTKIVTTPAKIVPLDSVQIPGRRHRNPRENEYKVVFVVF